LYDEHVKKGTLLPNVDEADTHGQFQFNFRHPHISAELSGQLLVQAFRKDFEDNGPSTLRIARTTLQGYKKHKSHPEKRIRERYSYEARDLSFGFAGALWAMEKYFSERNLPLTAKINQLRAEIEEEFGLKARILGNLLGRVIKRTIEREEKRLERGWTYEPPLFVERRNWDWASS